MHREFTTSNGLPERWDHLDSGVGVPRNQSIAETIKKNQGVTRIMKIRTAVIIVARVRPGTSEGITDLLLLYPSSALRKCSGLSNSAVGWLPTRNR